MKKDLSSIFKTSEISDAQNFNSIKISLASPEKIKSWTSYFELYLTNYFIQNGSGADIGPLKNGTTVLAGLVPDSQRYFDYHHSANDTFDAINKRELELGAAAMTSLVYLVDQFGF